MKYLSTIAAICMLIVFPRFSQSETFQISVQDSNFFPNDLVIQAGDIVKWTYQPESESDDCDYGVCPPEIMHNVTADDQSFSSGLPSDRWTYEKTFNQPGEILYHCEVHSSPGKDINNFMNGRITVQGEEAELFQINPGLSDAWFSPDTSGQGFFIIVFAESGQIFLAWFTYEVSRPDNSIPALLGEAGHRWITAVGDFSDNQAVLDIFITRGGIFDASPPVPESEPDGAMIVEFSNCNEGTVSYDIPSIGRHRVIPIERISLDNVPLCESHQVQLQ